MWLLGFSLFANARFCRKLKCLKTANFANRQDISLFLQKAQYGNDINA